MNRPHAEGDELSEAEKRDLIKLINEGKPLPEKYRFLLFQGQAGGGARLERQDA